MEVIMKIKSDYVMREIAGTCVVVPTGKASVDFSGMVTLNDTGAFLWKQLSEEQSERDMVQVMLREYDTDENTARKDIQEFIRKLKAADLLE
jgi:Coenzyme PQQ synthesis protein D (PqqD).